VAPSPAGAGRNGKRPALIDGLRLVGGLERLRRLTFTAVIAGLLAGLIVTGLQRIAVVPLILEAERYETAAGGHDHGHGHDHDAAPAHDHAATTGAGGAAHEPAAADHAMSAATATESVAAPAEEEGDGNRFLFTLIANVVAASGFGFLLAAAMTIAAAAGHRTDWKRGVLWGLAGFAAIQLAPALGLPPEVPGAAAAELGARQVWWILTAALTALGLALVVFAPRPWLRALGLVPIVVPHLIGAPQPEQHGGLSPAALASQFVHAALITLGVYWLILGGLVGFLLDRFERRRAAA
jgi:cobalt transporter subunit CbtA